MDSKQSSTVVSYSTDIVRDVLGDWGKWQLRTTLLIYLCKIPAAWFMACIIFTAPFGQPGEYVCRDRQFSDGMAHGVHQSNDDHCYRARAHANHTTPVECTDFEHHSIYDSLVTEFDLVCSRTVLIAVTQFWHLFGVLTGGILATLLLNQFRIVSMFSRQISRKLVEF